MATTIIIQPPTDRAHCLSECIPYTLRSSDLGNGENEFKRIIYRLFCVDTQTYLTDPDGEPAIQPSSISEFVTVDFNKLIACNLVTRVPTLGISNTTDNTSKKTVRLEAGTSTVDLDNCENNAVTWDAVSDEVTIINSYYQNWEDKPEGRDAIFMNTFSEFKPICKDAEDFIYVCGQVNIRIEIKDISGNYQDVFYGSLNADDISIFNVGPEFIADLASISVDEICSYNVYNNGIDFKTTYIVKDCCCSKDSRVDLYFLDLRGGYTLMNTTCVESMVVTKSGTEICRTENCFTDERDAVANFGSQYMVKQRWLKVSLEIKVLIDKTNIRLYQSFAASGKYVAKYFCPDEGKRNLLEGFIIETLDIPTLKEDEFTKISVTGYFSHGIKGH